MPVEVRRVKRSEFKAWARMRRSLWPFESVAAHEWDIREVFGTRGFGAWIAWQDERAIGFAEASTRPYANGCEGRPVPFLEGLWVESRFRRQGVGGALVEAVAKWAKLRGFGELCSDALLNNSKSHRAHRSYGFKETERVVYFRKALR